MKVVCNILIEGVIELDMFNIDIQTSIFQDIDKVLIEKHPEYRAESYKIESEHVQ
jgi:hypothetical protein